MSTMTPDTLAAIIDGSAETSACENCRGAVVEHGRNWIHLDGRFTCGAGLGSDAYALGWDGDPGEWHQQSYEQGHTDGFEEGRDEANDEHHDEQFTQDDLDEAQAEARVEALHDALAAVQALVDASAKGRR